MKTIERFLSPDVARSYSLERHSFARVPPEFFSSAAKLYSHYSVELKALETFRRDLADSLIQSPGVAASADERRRIAELWAHFLRNRVAAMEFWSTFSTALIAASSAYAAVVTIFMKPTSGGASAFAVGAILLCALLLLLFKARVDSTVLWFKFVSAQLEAISKVGANPSIEGTASGLRPPTAPHVKR